MPACPRRPIALLVAGFVLWPSPSADGRPAAGGALGAPEPAYGTYAWPVHGPVIRPFEPPSTRYGPGHRGIDIAVPVGTPVRAAGTGWIAFAGFVGGSLYVSVDHPDGIRTTYSWLSAVSVSPGDPVDRGHIIGASGPGHPGIQPPHLHFGARIGSTYVDPMLLLEGGSVVGLIHLAPLDVTGSLGPSPVPAHAARGPPSSPGDASGRLLHPEAAEPPTMCRHANVARRTCCAGPRSRGNARTVAGRWGEHGIGESALVPGGVPRGARVPSLADGRWGRRSLRGGIGAGSPIP